MAAAAAPSGEAGIRQLLLARDGAAEEGREGSDVVGEEAPLEAIPPEEEEQSRVDALRTSDPHACAFALLDHAAILLLEGQAYLKFQFHPMNAVQRASFRTLHYSPGNIVQWLELVTSVVLLLLALVEKPTAIWAWPQWASSLVELLVIAFFLWDLFHRARASGGWARWLQAWGSRLRLLCIFLLIVDILTAISTQTAYRPLRMVRQILPGAALRLAPCRSPDRNRLGADSAAVPD
jgi:hypothetical protein